MVRVLVIKLSSMGDVIHALPAITDAYASVADIKIDWLVDQSFQAIPLLHAKLNKVFTINLRDLKKHITFSNIKQIINTVN